MPELISYFPNWGIYARSYNLSQFPFNKSSLAFAFVKIDDSGKIASVDPWADFQKTFSDDPRIAPDSWSDGGDENSRGLFGQMRKLKQAGHVSKIYLSVGGWSLSGNFSTILQNETTKQTFANDIVAWLQKYPFLDGCDLDYEYPSDFATKSLGLETNAASPGDGRRFVEFLSLVRSKLPAGKTLSICCSADPKKLDWDIGKASTYCDFISCMTY